MPKYKIEKNPTTGGVCCDFEYGGNKYYADLSYVPFCGNECMIFAYEEDDKINWSDLYCNRGIPVTEEALEACIEEFTAEYVD